MRKEYFSNTDEIMAFSWTIANGLSKISKSTQEAFDKLQKGFNGEAAYIWREVKSNCDKDVIKKYYKYIYLYLEKIFEKKTKKTK